MIAFQACGHELIESYFTAKAGYECHRGRHHDTSAAYDLDMNINSVCALHLMPRSAMRAQNRVLVLRYGGDAEV